MNDSISREAAIDALGEKPLAWTDSEYELALQQQWESDVDAIKALPSAQPERKKGKWIIRDNPGTGWYRVTCSECGEDVTSTAPAIGFLPNAKVLWDYCPWCGADMRTSK